MLSDSRMYLAGMPADKGECASFARVLSTRFYSQISRQARNDMLYFSTAYFICHFDRSAIIARSGEISQTKSSMIVTATIQLVHKLN